MNQAMKTCEPCGGSGRIPRSQRRQADGTLDPLDILGQHNEICDRCGGSGEVPEKATAVVVPRHGYAADLISLKPPIVYGAARIAEVELVFWCGTGADTCRALAAAHLRAISRRPHPYESDF